MHSLGKRKHLTHFVASKKQRRLSTIDKSGRSQKTSMNNSANVTSRTTRNNGKKSQRNSLTMIQNNRELATALSKAKLRITELEDQGLQFKKDQHELRGKCTMLGNQLQRMKEEKGSKQFINPNVFKGVCQSLRLNIQKTTEKLLESTVFLGEVDESIGTLLKMSRIQNGENQNGPDGCSPMPLEITCDDSVQKSREAALSITKLTPSPSSSSSSSDGCEMATPEPRFNSTPSVNTPSLLSTMDYLHSPLEIPGLCLVLESTQHNAIEGEVNRNHDNFDNTNNNEYTQSGSMELDSHQANDNKQCPTWSAPPTNTPYPSSTNDHRHAVVKISDLHLILESSQNPQIGEEMDCRDDRNSEKESLFMHPGSMDTDSHITNSGQHCPSWSSPDCSPIRYTRASVRRLASTPEDIEISRFAANLTADSPQISPGFALCAGRRTLRKRNMYDGFRGYKEPPLNRKMRQGDPFSDCSLFQPRHGTDAPNSNMTQVDINNSSLQKESFIFLTEKFTLQTRNLDKSGQCSFNQCDKSVKHINNVIV